MTAVRDTRADQARKLQALVETLLESNRFYAAKLRVAGIDRGLRDISELCARVPCVNAVDLDLRLQREV